MTWTKAEVAALSKHVQYGCLDATWGRQDSVAHTGWSAERARLAQERAQEMAAISLRGLVRVEEGCVESLATSLLWLASPAGQSVYPTIHDKLAARALEDMESHARRAKQYRRLLSKLDVLGMPAELKGSDHGK